MYSRMEESGAKRRRAELDVEMYQRVLAARYGLMMGLAPLGIHGAISPVRTGDQGPPARPQQLRRWMSAFG